MTTGPSTLLTPSEQGRADLLVVTRRRATGLLIVATAIFIGSTVFLKSASWLAWVQATAAASMVGGLADWFAVTALFRRPLGLPIPHTAIVVERKDRFATTLGNFIQESFLSPEAVSSRLRATGAVDRAARWLADDDHAADVAGRVAHALVAGSDLLRDDDVREVIDGLIRQRLDAVALAPLAGRVLEEMTKNGRHQPLVDQALVALSRYIQINGAGLHHRLGVRSPWWVPGPLSDRMVARMLEHSEVTLAEMASDRKHPLRRQLDAAIAGLAVQLQTDRAMRSRGETLKDEFLAQPTVRDFATTVWSDIKQELRIQADRPGSELRMRLAGVISHTGRRLSEDSDLNESAQRSLDTIVRAVLTNFDDELVALVTGTIARWDATDTSRRLELLLGPDLQYVRINGTLVGALAGLALHAVSVAVH